MLASGSSIWYPNEVVVSCVLVLASNSTPTWIWWIRTYKQTFSKYTENKQLVFAVWRYFLYLFVGSVIIASMGSSFSSIQCCYPVWSLTEKDGKKRLHNAWDQRKTNQVMGFIRKKIRCWRIITNYYLSTVQPKLKSLLPPLVPDGRLALLLTQAQKTHSAGSVPQG